ncbi:hypothetical protein MauCBS54593_000195 [Microsporum audouinii]
MPYGIISTLFIRTIIKNGKELHLKYATKTTVWTRILLGQAVKDNFVKAMEKATNIPGNAHSAILAETDHPSESDMKEHFTTIFHDKDDNHIATRHIYP